MNLKKKRRICPLRWHSIETSYENDFIKFFFVVDTMLAVVFQALRLAAVYTNDNRHIGRYYRSSAFSLNSFKTSRAHIFLDCSIFQEVSFIFDISDLILKLKLM